MGAIARAGLLSGLIAAAWAAPAAGQAVEQGAGTDVVVARVGEDEIMLSDVVGDIYALPEQERNRRPFEEMYDESLERHIDRTLVYQAAVDSGMDDDPQYQKRVKTIAHRMLADAYMQRELARRVSEQAVHDRYDALAEEQAGRTELRARHMRAEDEAAAQALKARLDAGEDFAEVARELEFPSAERGGDLGFFTEDNMVPEVVAVARRLEVGEVSEPVDSPYGWLIIKLEGSRPMQTPSFVELRQELYEQVSRNAVMDVLDELRAETTVERFSRDGTPLEEPSPPAD